MNRFRTKKKVKDDSVPRRPSEESEGGLSFFGRRKKAPIEEEKPALDLENALPKTDDFRTSLLMTGLSARFSMLREQDDPNTKIGKASDDSVLYPKRQSRLADLSGGGFGGLGALADIAEVESIKAPAPYARMNSYASASDDADSNSGSVMNRSKPTEGNVLFGGRQKIYKIPAGAKSTGGGLGGRALYEDDVPLSSFQKWRQAQREQRREDGDEIDQDEFASTLADPSPRVESPPPAGYNRKRETSSTTSSAPSAQRNSTAATSVVSGTTQQPKEWQSPNPASNTSTPTLERNVTRTRRLYEQGLNQELQDQQNSALTRIDTIRRGLGSRTPDLSAHSPSPTGLGFNDRFDTRRNILTKSSAPNLRSFSPPSSGSSVSTVETGARPGRSPVAEARAVFGVEPPLSPPVSEVGMEQSILAIQPNDRGKATALGILNKPTQKYDESTYAQKQLQLQQGRDSPVGRLRAESNATANTGRSRSTSSTRRDRSVDKSEQKVKTATPLETTNEEPQTFLDDSDNGTEPLPSIASKQDPLPPVVLERPADSEHPAFRQSALPTPLSVNTKDPSEASPSPGKHAFLSPNSTYDSGSQVSDSPTLGPASSSSGLGGLVRSHLRTDSGASSVYGGAPSTSGLEARFPLDPYGETGDSHDAGATDLTEMKSKSNPWEASDSQWGISVYGINPLEAHEKKTDAPPMVVESKQETKEAVPTEVVATTPSTQHSSSDVEKDKQEQNEFARELAEGARRVRERLTSYVESDSSLAASPHSESPRELQPPRAHGLGLLKPKNSRGSLVDRNRGDPNSKTIKMLGLGSVTMTTSPNPGKQSFDEASSPLATMKEEPGKEEISPPPPRGRTPGISHRSPVRDPVAFAPTQNSVPMPPSYATREPKEYPEAAAAQDNLPPSQEDPKLNPGVKAFRQARRELQRLKELELQTRHQAQGSLEQPSRTSPPREDGRRQRTPSRERKPPPVFYQARPGIEDSRQQQPYGMPAGSRAGSRATSRAGSERDRSGSETSNSGRSQSRPPRLRNGSIRQEDGSYAGGPAGLHGPPTPLRNNMMRSPGLPGSDIRRSPHMPPQQGHPGYGGASPSYFGYQPQPQNGNLQPVARHDSGHPSPISPVAPMGWPSSPFAAGPQSGATTPTGLGPPRPRGPSAPTTPSLETAPNHNAAPASRHDLIKKQVRKNEISDPTFVSSTSRVPTVSLPENTRSRSRSGSRSRSNSNATQSQYAPPLPPINPRRRTETKTRTMIGNFMGRANGLDEGNTTASSPHLPLHDHGLDGDRSAFSHSEDEDEKPGRRRLRKIPSEANAMNSRARSSTRGANPQYGTAPPASRTVMSPPRPPPSISGMGMDFPGGMI